MNTTAKMRKIVKIDPDKCNGCGLCVPSCAEGAIKIVNGKAELRAENLCDGLGACLGECPQGAITIEERSADAFDEHAVQQQKKQDAPAKAPVASQCPSHAPAGSAQGGMSHGGCPGSMMRMLNQKSPAAATPAVPAAPQVSQLNHWPVQLALLPASGPIWKDADVLIAADCVAFAMPDFQQLLAGKSLAIACPKLDDVNPYVQKLATIFANNTVKSITVAHMEVPCCTGIVRVVRAALEQSGRTDIPVRDVTVGINGTILWDR